ncbi:MAG: DUF790 family protein [SAR324 cluster bacterium]|nr:DUF790 family protein [SAR324 cluster bacterium]
MLTGDLLLYTRRAGTVWPRLLDPAQPALLSGAEALLELCAAHLGRRRGELEEALRDFPLPAVQARVGQGLAKLLLDRCTFEAGGAAEPRALRSAVFDGGAEGWRRHGTEGLAQWREALLAQVGAAHGMSPEQVQVGLYADLAENQLLVDMRALSPEALILRYNVAQVQGLLLRAGGLTLRCPLPPPQRLRQLFGYLKFFGLLFQVTRRGEGEIEVLLDGPLSLLESGSRYGLNLAQFLPALLNWDAPWTLHAVLTPRPGKPQARLELAPHPLLKSHYPERGQWVPEELRQFASAFNALDSPWRCLPAEEVLQLQDNAYLIPDFAFRGAGGRLIYLEYLRYPVRQQLEKRLALIDENRLADYAVACRQVPAVMPLAENSPHTFTFRRTLLPGQVNAFLNELASA